MNLILTRAWKNEKSEIHELVGANADSLLHDAQILGRGTLGVSHSYFQTHADVSHHNLCPFR